MYTGYFVEQTLLQILWQLKCLILAHKPEYVRLNQQSTFRVFKVCMVSRQMLVCRDVKVGDVD